MAQMLKNNSGFSLVELVIVMLIIGLLSAMAIPSFMTYQAKSRQVEATSNLSSIFSGEQSYYSEQGYYLEDVQLVGFGLSGKAKFYDFTATAQPVDPLGMHAVMGSWAGLHGVPGNGPPDGTVIHMNTPPGVSLAPPSFTAIAVGDVNFDGIYDVWSINDKDLLTNDFNDTLHG